MEEGRMKPQREHGLCPATPQAPFVCIDEDMYPRCTTQCAECKAVEERERAGTPPEEKEQE